jgi:hypothetical protein
MTEISKPDFDQYLQPGRFVDSDAPTVVDFAQTVSSGSAEKREKAVSISTLCEIQFATTHTTSI